MPAVSALLWFFKNEQKLNCLKNIMPENIINKNYEYKKITPVESIFLHPRAKKCVNLTSP